ncbi:MAG TPA: tetratricopeptide repeat protein [Chryseolinea sp.]|nr:tetratricopeptide repeat protein [Chryseolinea sp.]
MCLLHLSLSVASAQTSRIDSLKHLVDSRLEDTSQVKILTSLAFEYWSSDPEKLLSYAKRASALSDKINFENGKGRSFVMMGIYYWQKGAYDTALSYYDEALVIFEAHNNVMDAAKCYHNIAMVYRAEGKYDLALTNAIHALRKEKASGNRDGIAGSLNTIGLIYKEQKQWDKALNYYFKSYDLYKEMDNKPQMGGLLTNIGNIYFNKKQNKEAIKYHKQSYRIFNGINNTKGKVTSLNNLGNAYKNEKVFESAIAYYDSSIVINERLLHNNRSLLSSFLGLAEIYSALGLHEKAISYYRNSLAVSNENIANPDLILAYQGLSNGYEGAGDYKNALRYHQLHIQTKDSIFNEETAKKIAHIEASYEGEKKQAEIELLKKDKQLTKLVQTIVGLIFSIIVAIAIMIFSRQRLKIKKEKELRATQLQVFNTRQALTESELHNSKLKEEQLESELAFKSKQLTTYTLNLVQKNRVLNEIRSIVHEIVNHADNGTVGKFQSLNKLIDFSFSLDKDWEEFKMYFEQVYTNFFVDLKKNYTDLTPGELRLCAFVKLNLSLKEIANILGISPESVKIARHRLRKKMNLSSDQDLAEAIMFNKAVDLQK